LACNENADFSLAEEYTDIAECVSIANHIT